MIAYSEALDLLRSAALLPPQTVSLADATGHIAAETITSPLNIPPFANSAMDGFAVRAEDITDTPTTLPVIGSSAAGDRPALGDANAWEIMTGAAVPDGYDSVIKIEDTDVLTRNAEGQPESVQINHRATLGQNIRRAGTDFSEGDSVIEAGSQITPLHIMALAASGTNRLKVRKQPRVTILSTGKEIINDLSAPLAPGQIYNSNAPYLAAMLKQLSASATFGGSIPDDPDIFETCIEKALPKTDLIISTGAVSAGRYDFIPDTLRKLGAEIHFHKAAVRPGKPILYARFPDGTLYLGLPGNPISAATGLRFFGMPLVRHITGTAPEVPITAKLTHPNTKPHAFRFFAKARLTLSSAGTPEVTLLTGQESYKIKPLLSMDAWAEVAEDQHELGIGDAVRVWPLMPGAFRFGD